MLLEIAMTIVCLNPFLEPHEVEAIQEVVDESDDMLIMPYDSKNECTVYFVKSDTNSVYGNLALFDDSMVLTPDRVRALLEMD